MKKVLYLVMFFVLGIGTSFAANPFDEFKSQLDPNLGNELVQKNLDTFAKDLGGLLGGGSFHNGQALGIPGFDVGIHAPIIKVNQENAIVKAAKLDTIALPMIQAEIGLPAKIDLIGRYTSYADATMIGAGLRYGIFKAGLPGLPSLSVQGIYNMVNVTAAGNKFKANTLSAQAVLSFNIPVINPYIGAGIDSTNVEPDATVPLPASGMKGSAMGNRIEAGVNLGLFPFSYLQLGAAMVNSEMGYTAGFGLRF